MTNTKENTMPQGVDFLEALRYVRTGETWARHSWCKGNFIYMVPGSVFKVSRVPLLEVYPEGTDITYKPHIDMHYDDGTCGVYTFSQDDVFANDWFCVSTQARD